MRKRHLRQRVRRKAGQIRQVFFSTEGTARHLSGKGNDDHRLARGSVTLLTLSRRPIELSSELGLPELRVIALRRSQLSAEATIAAPRTKLSARTVMAGLVAKLADPLYFGNCIFGG